MKVFMKNCLGFLFLIFGTVVCSNSQSYGAEKWQHVPICALIKDHKYDGMNVYFHAKVLDGHLHGILLKDDHCNQGLTITASDPVRTQHDYMEFMRTLYSTRTLTGDHTIEADFYGKFVYDPSEPRLKWNIDVKRISNINVN